MTVRDLTEQAGFELLNPGVDLEGQIKAGCCCDLLSWVMASGEEGAAWVTVQTHMNVVAVASLHDFSCIVLSEGNRMAQPELDKATDEGIPVLTTGRSSYTACCVLHEMGV